MIKKKWLYICKNILLYIVFKFINMQIYLEEVNNLYLIFDSRFSTFITKVIEDFSLPKYNL